MLFVALTEVREAPVKYGCYIGYPEGTFDLLCIDSNKTFAQFSKSEGNLIKYNQGFHYGGEQYVRNLYEFQYKDFSSQPKDLYLNGGKAILGSLHIGIYQDKESEYSESYTYSTEYDFPLLQTN